MPRNSENQIIHVMTCDLFFWEGETSHCFLQWGDKRDPKFRYMEILVHLHRENESHAAKLKVHYALHNPQNWKAKDRVIKTAVLNFTQIEPTGFFNRK